MVNDKHRCPYENIFPILICVFIFSLEYFFLWKWWNIHVYFFNTISESLNKLLYGFCLLGLYWQAHTWFPSWFHFISTHPSLHFVQRQTNGPPPSFSFVRMRFINSMFIFRTSLYRIDESVRTQFRYEKDIIHIFQMLYVNKIHAHICISNLALHKSWNE